MNKPDKPIPIYQTEGKNKVMYHATEPENVPGILRQGLKAPVYMMNGRRAVRGIENSTRENYAKYGTYSGGHQVLLRIKLPGDWPLMIDEASDSPLYVKSMASIPRSYITVDKEHWP